jgi:hypothetical protein
MSYLRWDGQYQELLEHWITRTSLNLITDRRYRDMSIFMSCLDDFDSLGQTLQTARNDRTQDAQDWLAEKISCLASSLSDHHYRAEDRDQEIYYALERISDYCRINKIGMPIVEVAGAPRRLKIPKKMPTRINLNYQ